MYPQQMQVQDEKPEVKFLDKFQVFHSSLPSMQTVMKDGTSIAFINGKAYTKNPEHAAELMKEARSPGNQYITYDPNETELSDEEMDPRVREQNKMRAEILAELGMTPEQWNTRNTDAGNYPPSPLHPGNTMTMAAVNAGRVGNFPSSAVVAGTSPAIVLSDVPVDVATVLNNSVDANVVVESTTSNEQKQPPVFVGATLDEVDTAEARGDSNLQPEEVPGEKFHSNAGLEDNTNVNATPGVDLSKLEGL